MEHSNNSNEQINMVNQIVVPLIHVESVLNRVIPDLQKILSFIQKWDEPAGSERCITGNDINEALAKLRKRMVKEIRLINLLFCKHYVHGIIHSTEVRALTPISRAEADQIQRMESAGKRPLFTTGTISNI